MTDTVAPESARGGVSAQGRKRKSAELPICRVETVEQFEAMSSPIRAQIITVVASLVTASDEGGVRGVSAREIARQVGRRRSSIYRHLDAMVEAGLLETVGSQSSGGRDASMYAVPGEVVMLVPPQGAGPELDAMCAYIESVAKNAGRETARATEDRVLGRFGVGPNDTGGATLRGWLTPEQRGEFRELMQRMNDLFVDTPRRPGTRLMAATFMFRPCRMPDDTIADEPALDGNDEADG